VQFAKTRLEMRKDLGAETPGLSAEALQQPLFASADKASVLRQGERLPSSPTARFVGRKQLSR